MKWEYQYIIRGDWPFSVKFEGPAGMLLTDHQLINKWCTDTFGSPSTSRQWYTIGSKYFFQEKSQAEMFLLRWS